MFRLQSVWLLLKPLLVVLFSFIRYTVRLFSTPPFTIKPFLTTYYHLIWICPLLLIFSFIWLFMCFISFSVGPGMFLVFSLTDSLQSNAFVWNNLYLSNNYATAAYKIKTNRKDLHLRANNSDLVLKVLARIQKLPEYSSLFEYPVYNLIPQYLPFNAEQPTLDKAEQDKLNLDNFQYEFYAKQYKVKRNLYLWRRNNHSPYILINGQPFNYNNVDFPYYIFQEQDFLQFVMQNLKDINGLTEHYFGNENIVSGYNYNNPDPKSKYPVGFDTEVTKHKKGIYIIMSIFGEIIYVGQTLVGMDRVGEYYKDDFGPIPDITEDGDPSFYYNSKKDQIVKENVLCVQVLKRRNVFITFVALHDFAPWEVMWIEKQLIFKLQPSVNYQNTAENPYAKAHTMLLSKEKSVYFTSGNSAVYWIKSLADLSQLSGIDYQTVVKAVSLNQKLGNRFATFRRLFQTELFMYPLLDVKDFMEFQPNPNTGYKVYDTLKLESRIFPDLSTAAVYISDILNVYISTFVLNDHLITKKLMNGRFTVESVSTVSIG